MSDVPSGNARVTIEHFANHPVGRQYCFVLTKPDGSKVTFGCDTQENCERMLPHWKDVHDAG